MEGLISELDGIKSYFLFGKVVAVQGLLVEVSGIETNVAVGSRILLETRDGQQVAAEVIGFRDERILTTPFGSLEGIGVGSPAFIDDADPAVMPDMSWLGRVINGMGEPIDGMGPLKPGEQPYRIKAQPPPAHSRGRVEGKVDLGVRSVNSFTTVCRGQRMGIFAGSGVGKSVMLSMMAKFTSADITIIGLIGERGREVQEFLQENLGPEGLARSVVVVATSDESALMRRQAAYLTLTMAEYFRDLGHDVLCLMDSVTRFAMAQREIGLSAGEPPAAKGYTPTVFSELPRLLERAGPGTGQGTITGLFTVLVEGDDHNEPVSDAVRGILDGHIVLEREIAERGRYPAINVLKSVSRTLPDCNTDAENALVLKAKRLLSTYDNMAEMIRLGAYRKGSDPEVDEAIFFNQPLEQFLGQRKDEVARFDQCYAMLADILRQGAGAQAPQQASSQQAPDQQQQAAAPGLQLNPGGQ